MSLVIHNPVNTVRVKISPSDFVAEVKARYAGSEGFVGDAGRVQLLFGGRKLEDLKQLREYGIVDGSIAAHVAMTDPSAESIEYKQLAALLSAAHGASLGGRRSDPTNYHAGGGAWDPSAVDMAWQRFPAVVVGGTGLSRDEVIEALDDEGQSDASFERLLLLGNGTPREKGVFSAPRPSEADVFGWGGGDGISSGTAASSLDRETLIRLRELRRAKQALVPRGPRVLVAFDEHGRDTMDVGPPARIFRNIYVAQVGRFTFRLLHRLEGRWTGEAEVHVAGVAQAMPDVRVCTVQLSFDEMAGVWLETQNLTSRDGFVVKQSMVLRPVADGMCRVELVPNKQTQQDKASSSSSTGTRHRHGTASDAGKGGGGRPGSSRSHSHAHTSSSLDMTLTEQSESVLILTALSPTTGAPVLVETITLLSDMRRVRTVQRFDEEGNFQCLYLIRETRVLDSVTGAVMESTRRPPMQQHQ